jgi:type II secretory ATPase GspE/PulE/Tfp pilus assembly ATPase PilB-like protein
MRSAEPAPVLARPDEDELAGLGMSAGAAALYRAALARRAGLILIAGPPGSGKRTTVNAGLPRARDPLTAAIDRSETAELAVEAALDGRLVLAPVEADGAVAAILRLRGMGVEPFLLAAALRAVFAQRIVRRLCPACREPVQATGSQASLLGFDAGAVVWQAPGCGICTGSGSGGRTAVFEAVNVDADLRRLTVSGDAALIAGHAFRHAPNLAAAARGLVRNGTIAPEEAVRVSRGF